MQDKIVAVDLTALAAQEQCQVRFLLQKYRKVLLALEGDVGCTNLFHDIPLVDEVPVHQRRCISPSEYEVVSLHLCVDYWLLNSKTCKDAFPLSHIEESHYMSNYRSMKLEFLAFKWAMTEIQRLLSGTEMCGVQGQ